MLNQNIIDELLTMSKSKAIIVFDENDQSWQNVEKVEETQNEIRIIINNKLLFDD